MNRLNDKLTLFDGRNSIDLNTGTIKSIDLPQYPDEAWTWLSGKPQGEVPGLKEYYKAIPFLFRGVDMRASRVSSMPFGIFRGETEIDSSDDYKNVVGFMPNPKRLFTLIEMSLTLLAKSYLFNVRNTRLTLNLKYLNPTTIEEQIEDPEGLVGFKRTTTKGSKDLDVEDIIYFWPGDPWVELGPPAASPGTASLMASGVLANVDEFIATFFHRGAIKQTIWRAEGMPPAEQEKFIDKWKRFNVGIRNAFQTLLFNADKMEPIVVGEGIEGLQDQDLTREKKEDIAQAMGIPVSMLFTNASNYNTADIDLFSFYDRTITPEVEFIFSILNEQVFEPMGLRIKDKHESLDVYQKDEQVRSTAFVHYVTTGIPLRFAFVMLGLEAPDGHSLDELDKAEEEKKEVAMAATQVPKESEDAKREREQTESKSLASKMTIDHVEAISPEAKADLDKWERKALRRLKAGKNTICGFRSEHLSFGEIGVIQSKLVSATTPEEVKAAFADLAPSSIPGTIELTADNRDVIELTAALQDASKALRETA